MPLKWKPQHFLEFTFPLSLVSILGTKKFHRNTSTSTIILKIQIKNIFFSFLFSLTFLATKQCNKYKEISFQTQNFPEISKATVLETNRNSFEPKKEKNERILINNSILELPKFKINK